MSFEKLKKEDKKRFAGQADILQKIVSKSFEGKSTDFLAGVVKIMSVIEVMVRMVRQEVDTELMRRSPKSQSSG